MNKKATKCFVILFYLVFIVGTGVVTYIAVEANREKTEVGTSFFPYLVCTGIIEPNLLQAEQNGEPVKLKMYGVLPPSENPDALNGLDPEEEDEISRKTLLAYLYKRRIRFHPIEGIPERLDEHTKQGYVELYGVDVGKQLIANGQAFCASEAHPRLEIYEASEAEALKKRAGVWRGTSSGN